MSSDLDVVGGPACHDRMHAAGVVAEHAAQRVVVVCRRVGAEGEMMRLRRLPQDIEHAARLDARPAAPEVDLEHIVQVLREVDHDGRVA